MHIWFSSEVTIQEQAQPITVQNLRVGDHVSCLDGGADLSSPGKPQWCKVNGFVSATAWLTSSTRVADCGIMLFSQDLARS
jgi:hypothetical protein